MNDVRQITVDTYNKSAAGLAEKLKGIGSRIADIELAFKLAKNSKHARVLEIGCGDGRDAKEIVKRSSWFLGFDISEGMIAIACRTVPKARFEVGDATNFKYPKNLDIVFAFASLLHLNQREVEQVLENVHAALKQNGIFYITLKYADEYEEKFLTDEFGERMFYFYNPEIISTLASFGFAVVHTQQEIKGHTSWFEIALQKR